MRFSTDKLIIISFALLLLALFGGVLVSSAVVYKPWGVHDLERQRYAEILSDIAIQNQVMEQPRPILSVEPRFVDPVLRQPGDNIFAAFDVTNIGDRVLELQVDSTSGGKLVLIPTSLKIDPDGSATLSSSFELPVDTVGGPLEIHGYLTSNDPLSPTLQLTYVCSVAYPYATTGGLDAAAVETGETASAQTIVYSQRFDDFSILESKAASPVDLSFEPVIEEATLNRLNAKSAIRVTATHPSKQRVTNFEETCRILVGREIEGATWLEIPFKGAFRPRIGFYGPSLDTRGGLSLGVIELGSDETWSFIARFRGDDVPSDAIIADLKPEGLTATITPIPGRKADYRITLSLAADARPVDFQTESQGYVVFASKDDPNVSNWLPLNGAIVNRPAKNRSSAD